MRSERSGIGSVRVGPGGIAQLPEEAMLEREHDLATCLATLHDVAGGHGRFLVLEGPAGIGKTALWRAFLEAASETRVLILAARATELDRDLPFGGVRQLFQPVVAGSGLRRTDHLFRGAAEVTRQLLDPERGEIGVGDPYA